MSTTIFLLPEQTRSAVSVASERIDGLLQHSSNVAQWWVDLTIQLDDLSTRLMVEGEQMWRGLREQLTEDAPHLSSQIRRIDDEHEALEDELLRVRILAGEAAGTAASLPSVTRSVAELMARLTRLDQWTTQIMMDAYERDLGGEAS